MALEVPYRSIPDMFFKRVAATPNGQAFAVPNADDSGMIWYTWAQVGERASAIAAGLRDLGVGLEDRVAILSGTRYEWVLADLGINAAGAATTTVYPTTEPEDASYIVANSGSKVLIAENAQQALKIAGVFVTAWGPSPTILVFAASVAVGALIASLSPGIRSMRPLEEVTA